MLILASGCGSGADGGADHRFPSAEEREAMMEGRREAARLVRREWRDTIELQRHILEARARRSEYEIAGRKQCAVAFDSGFVSGIRAVRPELARDIFDR